MTESLPSARRMRCIATSEPSASPSGFSCVTSTKRVAVAQLVEDLARASRPPTVLMRVLARRIDDPLQALRALGGVVVDEAQRRACA